MPEESRNLPERVRKSSLYIHSPFCLYKCHYCDFNSHAYAADRIPFSQYLASLQKEILLRKNYFDHTGRHFLGAEKQIESIYFGGGTPSLMRSQDIEMILREIQKIFSISAEVEITLEANPKTITLEKLAEFKSAGVNRMSVGVQSLHDSYLSAFGRIHSADDARKALDDVSRVGFNSWNIDLIFGFPEQTIEEWQKDLDEILKWNSPHLSCYALTVEQGTPFEKKLLSGSVSSPDEETQVKMYDLAEHILDNKGYDHYEISNFSRPGFQSQHNLNYWHYGEFLGLGAGAVSFLFEGGGDASTFGYRTTNFKEPQRYMESLFEDEGRGSRVGDSLTPFRASERREWFDLETISPKTAMGEYMMMGLRLKKGVDPQRFKELFSISLEDRFSSVIEKYRQKGWFKQEGVGLTKEGFVFSNQVMGDFFVTGHE